MYTGSSTMSFITGLLAVVLLVLIVLQILIKRQRQGSPSTVTKLADALRDERLKSSIILDTIEDGVLLVDNQQTIQLFNTGASKITGWPSAEALKLDPKLVVKLLNPKGQPYSDPDNPFTRVFTTSMTIRDNKAVLATRSNKQIGISLTISPLFDEAKRITAAAAIFRDVSEERAQEQQRAEFISTASHEMRTPVAAIEGYLALALNDKVSTIDVRARDFIAKAYDSTRHLGKLFQDLLTSAKAEDGRLSNHPEAMELGTILQQVADDLSFTAKKKGLSSEFTLGQDSTIDIRKTATGEKVIKPLYYVYADPERLREVITNLFDNACKYTAEGKVTIGLTGDKDVVQFFVRDTGKGIATEDIPHLFQKFYRVDNSATRTIGGNGLGLFIARKIVELYDGRIWVESEVGKGSTFYVNLPRLSSQRAEQLQAAAAQGPTVQNPPTITPQNGS